MSISRILVPTDFSDCALRASNIASLMARKMNAELIFIHLFPDPEPGHYVRKGIRDYNLASPEIAHVKSMLDQAVKDAEHNGVPAKAVLVYNKGNDFIEDYASSYGADLIVMGSHGARGLVEWLGGGSNAQRVSRNSHVPVLVIKDCSEALAVKNILFASSFDENVIPAMLFLTELAKLWRATIHLLYVNPAIQSMEKKVAESRMLDVADKFPDVEFTTNFSDTNDEEFAISTAAYKLNADLITLTPHDRDGIIRFLSHSIAENLVNHEQLPVLVLPENE